MAQSTIWMIIGLVVVGLLIYYLVAGDKGKKGTTAPKSQSGNENTPNTPAA